MGGRERGRDRSPSMLRTVSTETDVALELTNCDIMPGAEVGRLTGTPKSEAVNLPIVLPNECIQLFPSFLFGYFRLRNIGADFHGEEMLEVRWRLSGIHFKNFFIFKD